MNKKCLGFFAAMILLSPVLEGLNAQNPSVRNVSFEQAGQNIVIRYDLSGQAGKKYSVSVALSDDVGASFRIVPKSLSGDAGKNVKPGTGKRITWFLGQDYPGGLEGEDFVFAVRAKLEKGSKKWPYVAGAAVAGGAAYFLTRSSKEKAADKGAVTVRVPGDI